MFRAVLTLVASFFFALGASGQGAAQEEKKKDPLDEPILGKTVGEWIKILRTHKDVKYRRVALIALEGSNTAGKSGLPALLYAIEKDEEKSIRQEGVMLLGRLDTKTPGAMKALVTALQTDQAGEVREAAATVIGAKFLDKAADYVPALQDALKDPHPGTRIAVAVALRNLGESARPAFPALFDAAKNPKEHELVRAAALHVLTRKARNNPQLLPLLLDMLKSTETPASLREAAADGLGGLGSEAPEVTAALSQSLGDKSLELRKASAVALVALGEKAQPAWPAIKARLTDPKEDSSIRNHLLRLSGRLGKTNPEAVKILTDAAISDTSTENRIAAIQELGELGGMAKEAIPALVKIADADARASVREAAAKAVKLIKLN
jgi:HEAT repeat protein